MEHVPEQVVLDFHTSVRVQLRSGRSLLDSLRDALYVSFGSHQQFMEAKGRMMVQQKVQTGRSPPKTTTPLDISLILETEEREINTKR